MERTSGCFTAWKCLVACLFLEESQHPTYPHVRQSRRWTQVSPVLRQSSQPFLFVCLILIWSRWRQVSLIPLQCRKNTRYNEISIRAIRETIRETTRSLYHF